MGLTSSSSDTDQTSLISGTLGDRCISCDAALAADQRYCINCGERRTRSRLALPADPAPAAPTPAASAPPATSPPRRRLSAATTLVAGVATLLLALGIGVEIGRLGNHSTAAPARANAPVQVVTVGGSGGAGGASTNSTAAHGSKHKAAPTKTAKAPPAHITKKVAAKATAAAAKVLGSSSSNLPPPTVTVGGACPAGKAGCQNGHFTGNFFGP